MISKTFEQVWDELLARRADMQHAQLRDEVKLTVLDLRTELQAAYQQGALHERELIEQATLRG